MPDAHYVDAYLAALYDIVCVDRRDEDFYLPLIRCAPSVLDVGCGTGTLLNRARAAGHEERLVGLDPADGMLVRARRHLGIEWVQGTLTEAGFAGEFDLIVMTGHAFQVLLTEDDVRAFLAAAHRALAARGRLAFETRNPLDRAWENWTPDEVIEVRDPDGRPVRVSANVESVDGQYVTFTQAFALEGQREAMISRSTLRFLGAAQLDDLLAEANFAVDERYGDWDRTPFTPKSPEIITVARPAGSP